MIDSILIIEDCDNDFELIKHAIESHCSVVRRVTNLEEGVRQVVLDEPDVVLLDIGGIGAQDSNQAVMAIKAVRTTKTAIVIVSAQSDPNTIRQAILNTASGWIVKGHWDNLVHEIYAAYQNHMSREVVKQLQVEALIQSNEGQTEGPRH